MKQRNRAPYRDTPRSIEDRLTDLMQRMTLEEQITQIGAVQRRDVIDELGFNLDGAWEHLEPATGQITRGEGEHDQAGQGAQGS